MSVMIFPVAVVYTLSDMNVTNFAGSFFRSVVVDAVMVNCTESSIELRSLWKYSALTALGRGVIPSSTNLKNSSAIFQLFLVPVPEEGLSERAWSLPRNQL